MQEVFVDITRNRAGSGCARAAALEPYLGLEICIWGFTASFFATSAVAALPP